MRLVVILENVIFVYHIEKCINIWKNLQNSVNQHFPNDQCMILQNHTWVKVQDKPMDTSVTENKIFFGVISDSRL